MEQRADLLEQLNQMIGCEYLSLMKELRWRNKLLRALEEIDINTYSYAQWSEALSYLFDEEIEFDSKEDIRTYIAERSSEVS